MKRVSIALFAVAMVATASTLLAQAPDEEQAIPAPAGNGGDIARLERRVSDLEAELKELKGRVSKHDDDLKTLAQGVIKNGEGISLNRTSIDTNRVSIDSVRSVAEDNDQKLRDIAAEDPSNPGHYNINLLGNMQRSESFRREVRRSTNRRLRIYNNTGDAQFLYINGTRWRVLPSRWSYAPVANGPVTVQRYHNGSRVVLNHWQHDLRGYNVGYDFWNHQQLRLEDDVESPSGPQTFASSLRN